MPGSLERLYLAKIIVTTELQAESVKGSIWAVAYHRWNVRLKEWLETDVPSASYAAGRLQIRRMIAEQRVSVIVGLKRQARLLAQARILVDQLRTRSARCESVIHAVDKRMHNLIRSKVLVNAM